MLKIITISKLDRWDLQLLNNTNNKTSSYSNIDEAIIKVTIAIIKSMKDFIEL